MGQTDFVCFAGREVEEIEISFADGLALPNRIEGTTIDKVSELPCHL